MKKKLVASLLLMIVLVLVGCGTPAIQPETEPSEEETPLKVAFIPGGDPDLEMQLFGNIMENVAEQIGRPIELQTATSYASIVEGLRQGHLDLARMGPFIYVLSRGEDIKLEPIVMEDLIGKGTSYRCILIARTDKNIKFAWDPTVTSELSLGLVEEGSTSGSVIPQAEGMNYDPPILLDNWQEVMWTGSHNASIAAVQNESIDVAFVADRRLYAAIDEGVVADGEIEILWESGPIPNSPFVARSELGLQTLIELEWAFRHVPAYLLEESSLNGFVPATDGDYNYIYRVGEEYDQLKQ